MQALNSRDVMVDAAFMETDRKIMTKGQPVPVYMLSGPKGDFTGLPPVSLRTMVGMKFSL